MLDARFRPGNVGTADGALDVILDVVDRALKSFCDVAMVRINAGLPSAALLADLEGRTLPYVSRLRANAALDQLAEPYMKRPAGRCPAEPRMWLYELGQAAAYDLGRQGSRGGSAAGSLLFGDLAALDGGAALRACWPITGKGARPRVTWAR